MAWVIVVMTMNRFLAALVAAAVVGGGFAWAGPAPDSKRLAQGKDFVADEQWARAIVEFRAAANDPAEKNRAEALFWLAHSEHQAGDDASALEAITRLEHEYPSSPWVRLAHSVSVEIAERMRRDDVLWAIAAPPPPTPSAPAPGAAPAPRPATIATRPPTPAAAPMPPSPPTVTPAVPGVATPRTAPVAVPLPAALSAPAPAPFATPAASMWWVGTMPATTDQVVRIEALAGLLDEHSDRVIPLLKDIALDPNSPDEARHAVFVLAHSDRPEAHSTVLEVARGGAEPVRIAAIRELGHLQDVNVAGELMRVYQANATLRIRRQVVATFGERADNASLLRIVQSEADPALRNTAIMTLGRIPMARDQLRLLYVQTPANSREAVLSALFTAKDDDELIRIASTEKNPMFRERARYQLRLLATPKAVKYLTDNP
jgi:hypothetical protein